MCKHVNVHFCQELCVSFWTARDLRQVGTRKSINRSEYAVANITLRNGNWDNGVDVQVKRGRAQNPEDNPDYGSRRLSKGESWTIPCDGQEVAWRRLVLGYPDETWTPWTRDSCFDDNAHDL